VGWERGRVLRSGSGGDQKSSERHSRMHACMAPQAVDEWASRGNELHDVGGGGGGLRSGPDGELKLGVTLENTCMHGYHGLACGATTACKGHVPEGSHKGRATSVGQAARPVLSGAGPSAEEMVLRKRTIKS
jgi:hypothetical protein